MQFATRQIATTVQLLLGDICYYSISLLRVEDHPDVRFQLTHTVIDSSASNRTKRLSHQRRITNTDKHHKHFLDVFTNIALMQKLRRYKIAACVSIKLL